MNTDRRQQLETYRRRVDAKGWRPRNCVWELTLACNLRCTHCGSRAGEARPDELSTTEALRVVGELGTLGCELLTLSGGEPTLRSDWDQIAAAAVDQGMVVNLVTNGVYCQGSSAAQVGARAKKAGLANLGVSIDGPREVHDLIRGQGTLQRVLDSIAEFRAQGMKVGVLCTVNRLNFDHLSEVRDLARDAGATILRFQLGKPMGSLSDHRELVLDPVQTPELLRRLADLKRQGGLQVAVGDSLGYFSPEDKFLRGQGWRNRAESWQGCQAGMQALGIQSDGGVKGCLSLQAREADCDTFVEGNLRQTSLLELWYRPGVFAYNRDFQAASLSGGCRSCSKASLCRGGARCVTSALGNLGDDPYCAWRYQARPSLAATVKATAASAAAVLCLTAAGCTAADSKALDATDATDQYSSQVDLTVDGRQDTLADLSSRDTFDCSTICCECDYGMPPSPEAYEACCAAPEYGISPDMLPGDTQAPDALTPTDTTSPDATTPDATTPDATAPTDAIDCDAVCCECEYGILPEAVDQACCQPPAQDVIDCDTICCDCDYGIPPEGAFEACCKK
jgi:MoaA/NifB/PqqE/SkfB family radical SAM enzyme